VLARRDSLAISPTAKLKSDNVDNVDNVVNEHLEKLSWLPKPWQRAVLRAAGGTGHEDIDTLFRSLSSMPVPSHTAEIAHSIYQRATNAGYRSASGNTDGAIRGRMSLRAKRFLSNHGQDALAEAEGDIAEWYAAEQHRPLAQRVAGMLVDLDHVDRRHFRLLAADNDALLDESKRIADAQTALHRIRIARGLEGIHPRDRDARSIRRRLRRGVGRVAVHAAGVLGLIGGPPHRRKPVYVDDWSLDRWLDVQDHNQHHLASKALIHPLHGQICTLAAAAETAKLGRESMWYAILTGIRGLSERKRWTPVFVTLTLPSEYHLHAST
jgi:hypothetical protein